MCCLGRTRGGLLLRQLLVFVCSCWNVLCLISSSFSVLFGSFHSFNNSLSDSLRHNGLNYSLCTSLCHQGWSHNLSNENTRKTCVQKVICRYQIHLSYELQSNAGKTGIIAPEHRFPVFTHCGCVGRTHSQKNEGCTCEAQSYICQEIVRGKKRESTSTQIQEDVLHYMPK